MDRLEVEKKFYLKNGISFKDYALKLGFIEQNSIKEDDEYFTDIEGDFIKNRTCLRIRSTNYQELEATFKGRSQVLDSCYSKVEKNLSLPKESEKDLQEFFESLGFLSDCIVCKKRVLLSKEKDGLCYNIAIDSIKDIGDFVEFEILADKNVFTIDEVRKQLSEFISKFNGFDFEEALLPYRDFVAQKYFEEMCPAGTLKCLMSDLDGTLIDSESVFYNATKNILLSKYGVKITKEEYVDNENKKNQNLINYLKENNRISKNVDEKEVFDLIYKEYEKGFVTLLKNSNIETNFYLLKQIKALGIKLGLVSTSKRYFINRLLEELKVTDLFDVIVAREDVENLKPATDAYTLAMKTINVKPEECLAIEDSLRGVEAGKGAKINTILVEEYNMDKNSIKEEVDILSFKKISNILLILINYLKG